VRGGQSCPPRIKPPKRGGQDCPPRIERGRQDCPPRNDENRLSSAVGNLAHRAPAFGRQYPLPFGARLKGLLPRARRSLPAFAAEAATAE